MKGRETGMGERQAVVSVFNKPRGKRWMFCRHLRENIVLCGKLWSLLNAVTVSPTGSNKIKR